MGESQGWRESAASATWMLMQWLPKGRWAQRGLQNPPSATRRPLLSLWAGGWMGEEAGGCHFPFLGAQKLSLFLGIRSLLVLYVPSGLKRCLGIGHASNPGSLIPRTSLSLSFPICKTRTLQLSQDYYRNERRLSMQKALGHSRPSKVRIPPLQATFPSSPISTLNKPVHPG